MVHQLLQQLAFGGIPEPVVDGGGITGDESIPQPEHFPVESEGLDGPVGPVEDGSSRRLIHAPVLHADEAVFDQVDAPHTVPASDLVEHGQQGGRIELLPIHFDRVTVLVSHLDGLGLVGCVLRIGGHDEHPRRWRHPRILEHAALKTHVQQIGIGRVGLLWRCRHIDAVGTGVGLEVGPTLHVPFTPGGNHFDVGVEGHGVQLEADLIVSLAGGTVTDGIGAGLGGRLDEALGDHRPGERGAQQVVTLVYGVGPQSRENEVGNELVDQVVDDGLRRSGRDGLFTSLFYLFALANVGGVSDHLEAPFLNQPAENDRGVETS